MDPVCAGLAIGLVVETFLLLFILIFSFSVGGDDGPT